MYARNLILNLKCRYVPGDEQGMILRSAVHLNDNRSTRRKRGKHKSRVVVQGNTQLPLEPVREADLHVELHSSSNTLLAMNKQISPKPSLPGKANILIQCTHGPCQRYVSMHTNKAWCFECEGAELYAPFLVHEDDRSHTRCPACLLETDNTGLRVTTQ